MLIAHPKHTRADLLAWSEYESADLVHGVRPALARKAAGQRETIEAFVREHPRAYVSVSWGKDSTVLAELCSGLALPYVWVRQEPIYNPDCLAVRDSFLCRRPETRYEEIVVHCRRGKNTWHATGTIEAGFAAAVERYGPHYLSGIRRDESGGRALRFMRHGLTTKHTCAPLGYWVSADIFGFLAAHQLPVHPVYAMLGGGRWQREHLRVCSLGGQRGCQFGRAEWEAEYYGDRLAALRHER